MKKLDDIRRAGDTVTDEELSAARQSVQPGDILRISLSSVSASIICVCLCYIFISFISGMFSGLTFRL